MSLANALADATPSESLSVYYTVTPSITTIITV
jgi:hypothetical protein